jgi:hypothetical protein
VTFAAEIRVVDLDPTGQTLGGIALKHDLLQLVFELPGGGLRHPEPATKFDARDALFGLGQVIDRTKPQPQMRRGEDRPGDRRGLPAALGALIEMARRHQASVVVGVSPPHHGVRESWPANLTDAWSPRSATTACAA